MALLAVLKMYNKARIDSFSNEVNTIFYDIEGEEYCYDYSYDRAKIYGVRPIIEVFTNELPN